MTLTQKDLQAIGDLIDGKVNGRFESIDKKLDGIGATVGITETRMDAMETRMDSMETDVKSIRTGMDAMETRMDSMETDVKSIRTGMDSMETRMDSMETDVKSIRTGMDSMETDVKSIRTRVDSLETNVNSIKTRVDSMEEDIGSIRISQVRVELEHVPRIQVALDGISVALERIENTNNNLASLKDTVEKHDIIISVHDNKIESIEKAIKAG